MNLIKWWAGLKWMDSRYDQPKEEGSLLRKTPLTWNEIFFRDRVSVIFNFVPLLILTIWLIIMLIAEVVK